MARRHSHYSDTLPARVRQHFALSQVELARFLGISRSMLAMVETGRKELGEATTYRLLLLGHYLPPPEGQGNAAPPLPAITFEDGPPLLTSEEKVKLRLRLKEVRVGILKARLELDQRGLLAQAAAQRRWALAELRTVLAAPVPPFWTGPPPDTARHLRWLDDLVADTALAAVPLSALEHTRRLARLRSLEAELVVLEAAWGVE